jgi:hypothetical protein
LKRLCLTSRSLVMIRFRGRVGSEEHFPRMDSLRAGDRPGFRRDGSESHATCRTLHLTQSYDCCVIPLMTNALHAFTNADTGMTSFVFAGVNGYNVTLRDDDSGEYVPVAIVNIKDEASAVAKAQALVAN